MSEPVLIVAPTEAVVEMATLRLQCGVDGTYADPLLELHLAAATAHVEKHIGWAIMPQEWKLTLDAFPTGGIKLPIGPVQSIDSFSYVAVTGDVVELLPEDYVGDLESIEARIDSVDVWPATINRMNAVEITWTAGTGDCPPDLSVAVLLLTAHLFDNREAVAIGVSAQEIPWGIKALLDRHRRFKG